MIAWKSAPDGDAAHLPFQRGVGEVEHRRGQFVFADQVFVVDEHGGACRDAGPVTG